MKVKATIDLIVRGDAARSAEVDALFAEVLGGVKAVVWPEGAQDFAIYPEREANGVKPIKNACIEYLCARGWEPEKKIKVGEDSNPGPIDAVRLLSSGKLFALEWETGNISSSHRAVNKMLLGLKRGIFGAAVLVLPSRAMYKFLTDRVGNLDELKPYFEIWKREDIDGRLAVIAIEHDREDFSVPRIPKGTDGRSKKRRRKKVRARKRAKR